MSQLRIVPHAVIRDRDVIEVWHDGRFIATVTADDGPGVRVISKHRMTAEQNADAMTMKLIEPHLPSVFVVRIDRMATPELTIGPADSDGGCPTCSHSMAKLTDHDPICFACDRCGTLVRIVGTHRDIYRPKLVDRCREFYAAVTKHAAEWHHRILLPQWHKTGIAESINRPEDRPS